MARRSKWIEVSSPDEPVVRVARRAINDRLHWVWRYLTRSSQGAPSDTENVHQLRVATRRAVATMELFERFLPAKKARWINKQLKRLRQSAGEARDLDVMLDHFATLAKNELEGPFAELVHRLHVRRHRAQEPIDALFEQLQDKHFPRRVKKLVARVRLREKEDRFNEPTFEDAGEHAIRQLAHEFFHAADGDFNDYTALHEFRIQGKRLRYGIEIFAGAFEPWFRGEVYPLVESLQERLGKVNDHVTAIANYQAERDEADAPQALVETLTSLIHEEEREQEAARQAFMDWWTPERREHLFLRFRDALGDEQMPENEPQESPLDPMRIAQG